MNRCATIAAMVAAQQSGQLSAAALLEECLAVIDRLDDAVQAWAFLDRDGARRAADECDRLRAASGRVGPLHGIPVGVKDIFDVAGMPTRAGSQIRDDAPAVVDAPAVARLRAAGAVILGKTVTTEFACFDPPPTRNPWNLDRTPGGSSSGSAAAVATGMCVAAIGSQTGGSIIRPASYTGVAGMKPSFGRIPLAGVVPVSVHLDHAGPLATSAADLATMFAAMADGDAVRDDGPNDASAVSPDPPRIGLLRAYFLEEAAPDVRDATLAAADRLRSAGAAIVDAPLPACWPDIHRDHARIMAVDAAYAHRRDYPRLREQYGRKLQALLDDGRNTAAVDYVGALATQQRLRAEFARSFADCDFLLTPATPTVAPGPETTGDARFNSPWSLAGLPVVSLPCALGEDILPIAVQIAARIDADRRLLAVARWCEAVLDFDRVPPLCRR